MTPEDFLGSRLGSTVVVKIRSCERVSWGSFERPATILFELHTNLDAPEACDEEGRRAYILNSFWVDDAELADFLSTTFGIPTYVAEFSEAIDDGSTPRTAAWTWQTAGYDLSDVTVHHMAQEPAELVDQARLFWTNGQGISFIDYNETTTVQMETPVFISQDRPVTGNFQEPMLHASMGTSDYVSAAGYVDVSTSGVGNVREFSDLACEKPLPS